MQIATSSRTIWELNKDLPGSILIVPLPYAGPEDLALARFYNVDLCFFLPSKESVQSLYNKIGGDCQFCFDIYEGDPVLRIENDNGVGRVTVIRGNQYQREERLDSIVTLNMRKWFQRLSGIEGCTCYNLKSNQLL